MEITISLAQINIDYEDIDKNVSKAEELIAEAANFGSEMIIFPELWTSGYDLTRSKYFSEINQKIITELAVISQKKSIWICGSYLSLINNKYFNSMVNLSPTGKLMPTYEKMHLFKPMAESKWLSPGPCPKIIQLPFGRTGCAICYDLRFPELFCTYGYHGVICCLIVAQWPLARIHHWKTLTQARAIENQCYIIAANSVGPGGKEIFGGTSIVISPGGDTLIEGSSNQEELLTVIIDTEEPLQVRNNIPILQDRRQGHYYLP